MGGGCLGDAGRGEDFAVDYEGDFGDGADLVAAGEEESWDGRCCEGGNGCVSPVILWLDCVLVLEGDVWGEMYFCPRLIF